ncbi:MAG TPA: hypothetical protein VGI67_01865 [Thermoleophilaceae bacterium]|jgi:hypothetical protein
MEPGFAKNIAHALHEGQRDRSGGLIVDHVERVAGSVPEEAQAVALLHDVLERTDIPLADLEGSGLSQVELGALRLLTRRPGESFEAHTLRIAHANGPDGRLARIVKLADIDDHVAHDREPFSTKPYGWARRHISVSLGRAAPAHSVA